MSMPNTMSMKSQFYIDVMRSIVCETENFEKNKSYAEMKLIGEASAEAFNDGREMHLFYSDWQLIEKGKCGRGEVWRKIALLGLKKIEDAQIGETVYIPHIPINFVMYELSSSLHGVLTFRTYFRTRYHRDFWVYHNEEVRKF